MVEKISVQIALEGTEEIKRQLAGISDAGQKAFADISAAAAKAGGFDRLDPTLVARKFSEFGITATNEINKITAALQTAGKTEAVITGVQKLEQGFHGLATAAGKATAAFGLTRSQIGALGKALRESGLGELGSQLGVLGRVGSAFGPVGIALTAISGGIAVVTGGLSKFASEASGTAKQIEILAGVSGRSVEKVSSLAIAFEQAGVSTKTFTAEMTNLAVKIADAQQKASADLWGPATEEQKRLANSVGAAAEQWQRVAAGGRAAFSSLTTVETKVQGLLKFLGDAAKRGEDVELVLADIVKNMTPLERATILPALGLSPETINALKQGRELIQQNRQEAERLGLTLTQSNKQALEGMTTAWNQFTGLVSAALQKIGAAAAPAFAQFLESAKQTLAQIVSDFQTLSPGEAVAKLADRIFEALIPTLNKIMEKVLPFVLQIGQAIGKAIADGIVEGIIGAAKNIPAELLSNLNTLADNILHAGTLLNDFIDAGLEFGNAIIDGIVLAIQSAAGRVWEAIKSALGFGAGGLVGGGEDTGLPLAGGGVVGGRGTGTSDSNLAWLSRGEFVVPAHAVGQPGVLQLLEALRRSGGNLRGVLDGMGRFAMGGLVPRPALAFADGGVVGARRSLNLTIEGRSFTGLSVPENTAQALERFAVHSQIASTGRKPSWRR